MRTVLVTVGTSLLANARRALDAQEPNEDDLARYLAQADPVTASAESNALSRLLQERDRVVLFHSQTEQGRRCAEALRRHFARRYDVDLVEVADLTYTESRFKLRGLRRLVALLAHRIEKERRQAHPPRPEFRWHFVLLAHRIEKERRQGREVVINATGGFKAEIAYATLVGILFDVPVSYIHEQFNELIEMPAMPVAWDYSTFADSEQFFAWIDGEEPRPTSEVERRWPHLPSAVRVLLEEDDGYTYLSAAGLALRKAYDDTLYRAADMPVYLSAQAARAYEQADPSIRALFARASTDRADAVVLATRAGRPLHSRAVRSRPGPPALPRAAAGQLRAGAQLRRVGLPPRPPRRVAVLVRGGGRGVRMRAGPPRRPKLRASA